ncbi:putative dimethylaniline monooxygenase [Didymella exigua CBS 183.55]|uniref:Putative dimethylaniline monooxygenase n=1 Tax=Didymella exigua CBS 183.55 TaxID=1150837 RepID=A0A6A5RCK4_9PLEO|nr:putative dimethylaniline monooxygenase [Didymella exigua CBS 183.55]KAF1924346.1 putative dimethylaniline monooxygenase [Didymella exigua CBS 183.55]
MSESTSRSVAIIGAGAAGAAAAAAFDAEDAFDIIQVFERRETPGGTWIYDPDPARPSQLQPGKNPPDVDPPLRVPQTLPAATAPTEQTRFDRTPIYEGLTTNVPEIIMSLSDERFAYGPFAPHWVPKQYIQNYFASHHTDRFLVLNTTVEDVTRERDNWRLTLRRHDPTQKVDIWWAEHFDALVIANGHYSIPYIPKVDGLDEFMEKYPGRVAHSKFYRSPTHYPGGKILIIGNSASGYDITTQFAQSGIVALPVYQSRRSPSRWDGRDPPPGVVWKPVITSYSSSGTIHFADGSHLDDIDTVIYCTGYKPSFPFWNSHANGGEIYDYQESKLDAFYQHTFSTKWERSLGIIGIPRVLTFRSFEYQAIALARLFCGREARCLPCIPEQRDWEKKRVAKCQQEGRLFHTILWDDGETMEWFRYLFEVAGLPGLEGKGRYPPQLTREQRWAFENLRKYPEPGKGDRKYSIESDGWNLVGKEFEEKEQDSAWFI